MISQLFAQLPLTKGQIRQTTNQSQVPDLLNDRNREVELTLIIMLCIG